MFDVQVLAESDWVSRQSMSYINPTKHLPGVFTLKNGIKRLRPVILKDMPHQDGYNQEQKKKSLKRLINWKINKAI